MQSKTSSFKGLFSPALFRNNLSRFWPLWALYLAAWLLVMPAMQLLELFGHNRQWMEPVELHISSLRDVTVMGSTGALIMSTVFGCLFAMALFSYLTNARAVGFAHALPARREGLFLTHYISGAAVFLTVHAGTALLTMAVWAAAGMREMWLIGVWFLSATGQMLFFYSFAVFCAMFAGQLLAIPVFYGVFNGLAYGLMYLIQSLCEMFFYGWSYFDFPLVVEWLTPVYKLSSPFWNLWTYDEQGNWSGADWGELQSGLGAVGIYALAGVVLTAAALAVYSRRRSESTGDTVAISWARPIFRYGVGTCAGLSFGQLLYIILRDAFDAGNASVPALAACMVALGLVGYFAAEMLLQKSFRVLKRSWKGGAALAAVLVLLCAALSTDLLGIEKYVPASDTVQSLYFEINGANYISGTIADPETIGRFLSLHRAVVEEQPENNWNSENTTYAGLRLNYTLKNGKALSRYYDFTYASGEERKDGSMLSQLAALMSDPTVRRADLSAQFLDDVDRLTAAEITLYPKSDGKNETLNFDADTAQTLLDALEKDVDAGHLGVDAFDEDQWSANTYTNRLTFYYREKTDPVSPQRDDSALFDLEFSKNDTFLLTALEHAGVDTDLLTTYEQMNAFDDGVALNGKAYKAYEKAQAEGRIPGDIGSAEYEDPSANTSAAIIGGADGPTEIFVAQPGSASVQEP